MKVEISTLKIKINKKTVTLSLAESKQLFEELNKIFGPKYVYQYSPTYPYSGTITVTNGTGTLPNLSVDGSVSTDITNVNSLGHLTTSIADTSVIDFTKQGVK